MRNLLLSLSRKAKQLLMLAADVVLLPLALWSAVALRLGNWSPGSTDFYWSLLLAPLVAIPVFIRMGLYRSVVRHMSEQMVVSVFKAVTLSALLLVAANELFDLENIARSSFVIYWGIALLYILGSRALVRNYLRRCGLSDKRCESRERVMIYGAGETGAKLALALNAGRQFTVLGFFDDNAELHGCEIGGIRVYSHNNLVELLNELSPDLLLLSIPSASRKRRMEIIRQFEPFHIPIKTIPSLTDLATGAAKVTEFKEVDVEDLLGRDAVMPVQHLLEQCICGKAVMVTGAGGSIGSELCRNILRQSPIRLVLFERSEFALYQIEQELLAINASNGNTVEIVAILGSVTHQKRVEMVLRTFKIQTIYHAAAYKHVPLVERNMIEGVMNNVFGTWRTAEAARKTAVETFVLISTDKAVRPTNVMGATKRLAELVLQALAREAGVTRYCMVRFGNVLGSSGSVVPLFRRQIAQGGPVTVTHPEITRYFMTIPEAANLVLQAGAMGQGGDVFVLDMGNPVKIVDLAKRMIRLSGFSVRDEESLEGDIAIDYTGLRPGEKLYEELLIGDNVSGTEHSLIMRAEEFELPWTELHISLERLDAACHQFDCETVRRILLEIADGYQPTGGLCDHVWGVRAV